MLGRTSYSTRLLLLTAVVATARADHRVELSIAAPEVDACQVPLHATITLPDSLADLPTEHIAVSLQPAGLTPMTAVGQVVRSGETVELWWIAAVLRKGQSGEWIATLHAEPGESSHGFAWKDTPGQHMDLVWDDHPVLRYMYAFDASTPKRLHETYKPYHHVFDAGGEKLLTKGPGGLYTHHRGIFIGWNKLKCGEREYDFWHMEGVTQRHRRILEQVAGPVLARSKTLIHWVDPEGKPVIAEQREVTVLRQPPPAILLLEFRTELKAVGGDVVLNGDPEHGGFQYRPHNDVAEGDETVKATYLFHEDGIDAHKDQNLPWAAMSYGLNGRRYAVQHMNHPDNPRPTVYSAYRDYGRFGAFFTKGLKAGETLALGYRIFVAEGEMPSRDELAARYSAFVSTPHVKVLSDTP